MTSLSCIGITLFDVACPNLPAQYPVVWCNRMRRCARPVPVIVYAVYILAGCFGCLQHDVAARVNLVWLKAMHGDLSFGSRPAGLTCSPLMPVEAKRAVVCCSQG